MAAGPIARASISRKELIEGAEALGRRLRNSDSALALLANNGVSALVGRQLANSSGVPLVPINPLLTATEIAHILSDSRCENLIVESELQGRAESALALCSSPTPALHLSTAPPLLEGEALYYEGSDAESFDEVDIGATLIYTSGTTGKPKGCLRSASQEHARARELIQSYSISERDIQLIASPLAHSAPGIFMRAAHAVGAPSLILRKFRPKNFWQLCADSGCTLFFLVPTQYHRLLEECRGQEVPAHVRATIVAGAPLNARLHRELIAWLGPNRLWQFYGSTETGTISIAPPNHDESDSVGYLAPKVELQVRDESGALCEPDSIGELFVRSPTVMSGYWSQEQNPVVDGFLSVGDLGYQDSAGRLYLVDRKHDTIISGGVNVYPAEVEAALLSHHLVRAAVVVGLDDKDWGQRVVALVATAESCSGEELRQHCRASLAAYKIPKSIHFTALDEMPIGASGKPLRRIARARLKA